MKKNTLPLDSRPDSRAALVSLAELSEFDREFVESSCRGVFPNCVIYGALKSKRSWDIRPVFGVPSHPHPYLMRFVRPEVVLSLEVSAIVERSLELQLPWINKEYPIVQYSMGDGQISYVRPYYPSTLAEIIERYEELHLEDVLTSCLSILREIKTWHAKGIFHGHLVLENIFIDESGKSYLLDFMVGGAGFMALQGMGEQELGADYNPDTFAPELLHTDDFSKADYFGFGLVLGAMLNLVGEEIAGEGEASEKESVVLALKQLSRELCQPDPELRPGWGEVEELIREYLEGKPALDRNKPKGKPEVSPSARVADSPRAPKAETRSERAPGVPPSAASRERSQKDDQRLDMRGVDPRVEQVRREISSSSQSDRQSSTGSPTRARPETPQSGAPKATSVKTSYYDSSRSADIEAPSRVNKQSPPAGRIQHPKPPGLKTSSLQDEQVFSEEGSDAFNQAQSSREVFDDEAKAGGSRESSRKPRKGGLERTWFAIKVMFLVSLLVFIGAILHKDYFQYEAIEEETTPAELSEWWSSPRPSQSDKVVRLALTRSGSQSEMAESLIINSALAGGKTSSAVNLRLLKVAMDKRWEAKLTDYDRLAALFFAAMPVAMQYEIPSPVLNKPFHPGVNLALAASLGDKEVEVLRKLPISTLTELPPPVGEAVGMLMAKNPGLTCADKETRLLAAVIGAGPSDSEILFEYLAHDVMFRLQLMAQLYDGDEKGAGDFLHTVLNHPNHRLDSEVADWASRKKLLAWTDLSNSEKLRLLSGQIPRVDLSTKAMAQLFEHPIPEVRAFGITKIIDEISFSHPAAMSILTRLSKNPTLLTAAQTVQMARALEDPAQMSKVHCSKFLGTNPPQEMLVEMLLSTANATQATALDLAILTHLRENKWAPSLEQLTLIIHHPDPVTRVFAYTETFRLADKPLALKMLTEARKKESDPRFQEHLDMNIQTLTKEVNGDVAASIPPPPASPQGTVLGKALEMEDYDPVGAGSPDKASKKEE